MRGFPLSPAGESGDFTSDPFSRLREKGPEADEGSFERMFQASLTRACGATSPASGRGESVRLGRGEDFTLDPFSRLREKVPSGG